MIPFSVDPFDPLWPGEFADPAFDNECRRASLLARTDGRKRYPRHCHVTKPNDNCPEWEVKEITYAD